MAVVSGYVYEFLVECPAKPFPGSEPGWRRGAGNQESESSCSQRSGRPLVCSQLSGDQNQLHVIEARG